METNYNNILKQIHTIDKNISYTEILNKNNLAIVIHKEDIILARIHSDIKNDSIINILELMSKRIIDIMLKQSLAFTLKEHPNLYGKLSEFKEYLKRESNE